MPQDKSHAAAAAICRQYFLCLKKHSNTGKVRKNKNQDIKWREYDWTAIGSVASGMILFLFS